MDELEKGNIPWMHWNLRRELLEDFDKNRLPMQWMIKEMVDNAPNDCPETCDCRKGT